MNQQPDGTYDFDDEDDALMVVQANGVRYDRDFRGDEVLLVPGKLVAIHGGPVWAAITYLCDEHGYVWRDVTNYN